MQAFFLAANGVHLTISVFRPYGLMFYRFMWLCSDASAIPLTLLTFPIWRYFAQRWADGLRILVWLPVVFLVSALLFNSEIIIVVLMVAVLVWFDLEARYVRKQGMPWKAFFIQARPIKKVTLA